MYSTQYYRIKYASIFQSRILTIQRFHLLKTYLTVKKKKKRKETDTHEKNRFPILSASIKAKQYLKVKYQCYFVIHKCLNK